MAKRTWAPKSPGPGGLVTTKENERVSQHQQQQKKEKEGGQVLIQELVCAFDIERHGARQQSRSKFISCLKRYFALNGRQRMAW